MGTISLAVIKLYFIVLLGFCLYKKKIITDEILQFLVLLVINFTVPALIFSRLIENHFLVLTYSLWTFIIVSFGIFFIGLFLGFIASFKQKQQLRRELISLVSFQNAGYLPMNIAFFLFSPQLREKFLVYIFLYLLGFNILMWSLGSFLIFKKKGDSFRFKSIFTLPVTATLIALFFIYTGTAKFIPFIVISPLRMLGEVSFVLSLIVLGCWMGKVKLKGISKKLFLLGGISFLKLIILPFLFLLGMLKFEIVSLLGVFLILQAAMPSALSLPIIANLRGADSEFVSQGVFLTHLLCIFTIPLWLGLYLKLSGFYF